MQRGKSKKHFAEFDAKFDTSLRKMEHDALAAGLPWRTVAATMVEREPVIIQEEEPWEVAYHKMRADRRQGTHITHVPDGLFEKKKEYDILRKQAAELVEKRNERRANGETIAADEIQDDELMAHIWELEFKPAPRITEADETDDRRSLFRRLDKSLFLLVKKDRAEHPWKFPQGGWEESLDGNSLRKTAEREFAEECGTDMPVYFISNAPNSCWPYAFPEEARAKRDAFGAKVFFFRATHTGYYGDLKAAIPKLDAEKEGLVDYAWVAPDEMDQYFDADFSEFIQQAL